MPPLPARRRRSPVAVGVADLLTRPLADAVHPGPAPPRRERVERARTCSPAGSTSRLTEKGRDEAARGGELLAEAGLLPDVRAHLGAAPRDHAPPSSRSTRATGTGSRCAGPGGSTSGTTAPCRARTRRRPWRSTARSSSCSGAAPTTPRRRRSTTTTSGRQAGDPRYADLPDEIAAAHRVPGRRGASGCCRTGTTRSCPTCAPAGRCCVAAHGNSLRALVKHLDGISDEAIAGLNIPTGIPLRLPARRAPAPDRPAGEYLDPDAAADAIEAVANQGR